MGSDALSEVGGGGDSLGPWQVRLAVLLALPMLLTGLYNTNYVFLAAPVSYRCRVPECEGLDPGSNISLSVEWSPEWLQWALPIDERCRRWRPAGGCSPHAFDNTTAVACKQFVYRSKSTIVAEFNLACQEWKRSLVGTVHNIGMLISLPIMGFVSDRYGRRAVLVACGCGVALLGLCKSFANAYIVYLVAELLETIMGASIYPAAFVLMIEWLGVKHRILASLLLGIPLSFGTAGVALLDYVTGYWRLWARVAYPPAFILLLYLWLLPESVRWLVTSGRMTDAVRVVKKAARCNRVAVSDEIFKKILMNETNEQAENKAGTKEEGLIKAFIKYGALRRRLCVCFVWWMSAVFVYYGLAVRAHALAGSPHVNYALVAAAELPALLLNTLLLDRVGRRPLLTAAFVFTAISLIALSCLPESCGWGCTALYLVGKVGATMSLNALYVYTAELFPTRARHRLLAACSTLGRLGSILAPLTPLLAVYGEWVPTALFGALPVASAALTPLVPDTLRRRLPDTFADLDAPAPTPPSRTTATTATTASSVTQHKGAV